MIPPHRLSYHRKPSPPPVTPFPRSSDSSSPTLKMLPEPPATLILRRFLFLVAVSLSCVILFRASDSIRFLPRFQSSTSGSSFSSFPFNFSAFDDSPLDADVMWFRDPFPQFYLDADFQIACDIFLGSSDDVHNRPNGGFNYVKSNNRSVEFYKFWYSSHETFPGYHDQDVLNIIKSDPFILDIGLKMKFLDTAYFGGLCEPSKDLNEVCTMHANCCFGLDNKLHDLRVMLQDWKHFMSLPPRLKRLSNFSWRVPQNCSLSSIHHYDSPKDIEEGGAGLT